MFFSSPSFCVRGMLQISYSMNIIVQRVTGNKIAFLILFRLGGFETLGWLSRACISFRFLLKLPCFVTFTHYVVRLQTEVSPLLFS